MGDLIFLEEYRTFRAAVARAAALAKQHKKQTQLERTDAGCGVMVHPSVTAVRPGDFSRFGSRDREDEYHAYAVADDDYQREVLEPLLEEMVEDQEDWARSEEEGWFYSDE